VDAADVVAFGDMPNDLEMLRWAGHGVAMGNAHPALLDVADEVTPRTPRTASRWCSNAGSRACVRAWKATFRA
jgi:phosphoserine phosphatase